MKHTHMRSLLAASALGGVRLEHKDDPTPGGGGGEPVSAEVKAALDNLLKTNKEFQDRVTAEIEQIKKAPTGGNLGTGEGADAVTRDEVKKLNDALDTAQKRIDELMLDRQRPQRQDGLQLSDDQRKHSEGFDRFFRKGNDNGLLELQAKALQAGSDPDGGYLVPVEVERAIDTRLKESSPMRGIATVRQIGTSTLRRTLNQGGAESGWVGETSPRPETDTPTLAEVEFHTMELYANPSATQTMLDDAVINVEDWLANEVEDSFTRQENAAFVAGDGVVKPRGFLNYPRIAGSATEAPSAYGSLVEYATGAAGDFLTTAPGDEQDVLIDVIYGLDEKYRANARWAFNKFTQARIRKIRDADGNPVWAPNAVAGQPATLMGYPIAELGNMPNIGADAAAMAFGDFRRGYLILDRVGIRVLRDPYTKKPFILFYTTKRVGGAVQDFDAIRIIRFGV